MFGGRNAKKEMDAGGIFKKIRSKVPHPNPSGQPRRQPRTKTRTGIGGRPSKLQRAVQSQRRCQKMRQDSSVCLSTMTAPFVRAGNRLATCTSFYGIAGPSTRRPLPSGLPPPLTIRRKTRLVPLADARHAACGWPDRPHGLAVSGSMPIGGIISCGSGPTIFRPKPARFEKG